jgi:8-amino-7-oxononanoate synthase
MAGGDFSSALYLGLCHASSELRAWSQLTTGQPAALAAPPAATEIARTLAALQGCEAGTLAPSTLHVFWDLFTILSEEPTVICVDSGAYPIACWGIERARKHRVPVVSFAHHDASALARRLARAGRHKAVVVADGFCPSCGKAAPVREYLEAMHDRSGALIIDDTQALGILGSGRSGAKPFGSGGGGSLRWHGVQDERVVLVSSLAKGFGAPVAVLSGSSQAVRQFEERSETRVHCSPPSYAALHAAERALALNDERGDQLRLTLARNVQSFRRGLRRAGVALPRGLFPVQTLAGIRGGAAVVFHARLRRSGISAVLHRRRRQSPAEVSFLLSANHTPDQIDEAVHAIGNAAASLELEDLACDTQPITARCV